MKITFNGTIPKNRLLNIKVGKKSSFVTCDIPSASININNAGIYKVKIYQDTSLDKWWQKILFFLVYIVLAPINIILLNNDDDWHENIDPYAIDAEFEVTIENTDKEICFEYLTDPITDSPFLLFEDNMNVKQSVVENPNNIDKCCGAYMMRISSIFFSASSINIDCFVFMYKKSYSCSCMHFIIIVFHYTIASAINKSKAKVQKLKKVLSTKI